MARTNEKERCRCLMYQDDEVYKFKATITYCRYYSDESSWGVYNFATNDDIPHYVQRNKT